TGRRTAARLFRGEELANVGQRSAIEAPAREPDRTVLVAGRLRVREIYPAVLVEARVDRDGHQPAPASGIDLGQAADRLRLEHAVANDPKARGAPLGNEQAAVRQECEVPRPLEPLHWGHADRSLLRGLDDERRVRQRPRRQADLRERGRGGETDEGGDGERGTVERCHGEPAMTWMPRL